MREHAFHVRAIAVLIASRPVSRAEADQARYERLVLSKRKNCPRFGTWLAAVRGRWRSLAVLPVHLRAAGALHRLRTRVEAPEAYSVTAVRPARPAATTRAARCRRLMHRCR